MSPRHAIATGIALLAGLGLAVMDSGRGFDATGVTVAGLILAGATAAFVDGSGSWAWGALFAACVGGWIPILESGALPASAAAIVFGGIGAFSATLSRRLLQGAPDRL